MPDRLCSCGLPIPDPLPVGIQRDNGVPLLILHNCPSCKSTRAIPWAKATHALRIEAGLVEMARDEKSEMTCR
jgi:hypothetical protein